MLEFSKIIQPDFDFELIFRVCDAISKAFASYNLIENAYVNNYGEFLKMQYLLEISKKPIIEPVRFLFTTLAQHLEIDFELVKDECEKARNTYIKLVNSKTKQT